MRWMTCVVACAAFAAVSSSNPIEVEKEEDNLKVPHQVYVEEDKGDNSPISGISSVGLPAQAANIVARFNELHRVFDVALSRAGTPTVRSTSKICDKFLEADHPSELSSTLEGVGAEELKSIHNIVAERYALLINQIHVKLRGENSIGREMRENRAITETQSHLQSELRLIESARNAKIRSIEWLASAVPGKAELVEINENTEMYMERMFGDLMQFAGEEGHGNLRSAIGTMVRFGTMKLVDLNAVAAVVARVHRALQDQYQREVQPEIERLKAAIRAEDLRLTDRAAAYTAVQESLARMEAVMKQMSSLKY